MSFSEEDIIIPKIVEEFFDKNFERNKKFYRFLKNYQLTITGPISSGKSTLLQGLMNLFKLKNLPIYPIYEYINYDTHIGGEMLQRFIRRELSNSTFQNYILDTYAIQLKKNKGLGPKLYERTIDDSIMCFANIANYNNCDLTILDLFALFNKGQGINVEYNVPTYLDINDPINIPSGQISKIDELRDIHEQYPNGNTKFTKLISNSLEDSLITVLGIIKKDMNESVTKRIIGLSITLETCRFRINKRSRNGESEYSDEYLNTIIKYYNRLYERIEKKQKISFTTIGNLVE